MFKVRCVHADSLRNLSEYLNKAIEEEKGLSKPISLSISEGIGHSGCILFEKLKEVL
jgi:hypothetical protein